MMPRRRCDDEDDAPGPQPSIGEQIEEHEWDVLQEQWEDDDADAPSETLVP